MDNRPPNSQEKPNHLQYLSQFRVDPCPLFKQHQCQQHRPYTCFNWHFANQRRRRPIRKPDGSFNYSPDLYCDKYDENTGICPEGDSCPFLHRVSGDVERKYHLRYYKTAQCVHGTDARGQCMKNGPHCAFAHSAIDLRQPQHDPNEAVYLNSLAETDGRDRTSFVVEDPLWHSQDHVLSCYKTELCRKPARLCRQGYACPFYHNSKDRRRPPAKYKYRSTPCPAAKTVDEWLDPEMCENGDNCGYCHTRTEQQFHPEIYKSTKCNDMLEHGYCPRAVFCAFAHHDSELHVQRTPYLASSQTSPAAGEQSPNGFADVSRFGSPTVNGMNPPYGIGQPQLRSQLSKPIYRSDDSISSSYPKAPGFERGGPLSPYERMEKPGSRIRTHSLNMGNIDLGSGLTPFDIMGTSLPSHSALNRSDSGFNAMSGAMEELTLDLATIDEQSNRQYYGANAISSPMRIPGASDSFHNSPIPSYGESLLQPGKMSLSSPTGVFSPFPNNVHEAVLIEELSKTKEELNAQNEKVAVWEEGLKQARQACEAWKSDAEVYKMMAEKAEMEKRRAYAERDQLYHQLEEMRARLGSNASEVGGSLASNSSFNVFGDQNEPVCPRCGKDRSRFDRASCQICADA
ncbi:hypothetical protein PMAYCL1PPCAC_30859 [Pristionchus mayeri]|uniref:C3H1-type domain-containing protein n=1 Tax=Pristionchus mayeri TaxID=1317129 RepID=A0AAN5DCM7_9BILA|nr:hypothetical protein PMAYCL1PPCAC_30859 [Pristionchus mayeri]